MAHTIGQNNINIYINRKLFLIKYIYEFSMSLKKNFNEFTKMIPNKT